MNDHLDVKIYRSDPRVSLPNRQSETAAGFDVQAFLPDGELTLEPMGRSLVPTGLFFEIPPGSEIQVRPRSGLAIKHGLSLLNSPGTIDSDYRGELKIILANLSNEAFVVTDGMRIAQLVFARLMPVRISEVAEYTALGQTARGQGGFGHTGTSS